MNVRRGEYIDYYGLEDGEIMENKIFYTFNGYMKKDDNFLTASMEDYLEMIYRLSVNTGFTRINILSQALNVQPPSTTKMVQHLANLQLVKYEKYGVIALEEKGKEVGARLLKRHNTIENFMSLLGVGDEKVLEETEKIEHMLSDETIKCFEDYMKFMKNEPDLLNRYRAFQDNRKNT